MSTKAVDRPHNMDKPRKKKRKYIPGLAAMKFRPRPDWLIPKAQEMCDNRIREVPGFGIDKVHYEDCIAGMQRMPKKCVDLIIADPPFGIDFSGKDAMYNRKSNLVIDGYHEVGNEYRSFSVDWISELPRIMKDDASAYVFSGWNNLEHVLAAARLAGLTLLNQIIWQYQFGVFTRTKYVTSHYNVLLLVKDLEKYYYHKIEHYPLDVWEIPRRYRRGKEKNGTVLPVEVVRKCIDFSSKPGDLVFDPFMGNGTTAVVAKENFRHFLGFELNENLRDLITENLNATTVGKEYTPYASRLPTPEDLKKKYPRAYKIYMKSKGRGRK